MSFESDLIIGVGELLDAQGAGVWSTSGGFGASDTAIVFGDLPDKPVAAIGLTPYPVQDDGYTGFFVLGLNVRARAANFLTALDMREAVRDVLNNRRDYVVGGVTVTRSWFQSGAALGADENWNQLSSDNYYVMTGRQVLH